MDSKGDRALVPCLIYVEVSLDCLHLIQSLPKKILNSSTVQPRTSGIAKISHTELEMMKIKKLVCLQCSEKVIESGQRLWYSQFTHKR